MDNEKILIVGGTFNNEGGSSSQLVEKVAEKFEGAMIINGGMPDFLKSFIEEGLKDYSKIFWMPENSDEISEIETAIKSCSKVCFIEIKKTDEDTKISCTNNYGVKSLVDVSIEEASEQLTSEKIFAKPVEADTIILLERLHLRIMDNCIDILYRPNHNYFAFVPNDENGKAEVKRLAEMSRDEFAAYLKNVTGLPSLKKEDIVKIKASKLEEWWNGAWKMQTVKLFDELAIINPIEEPIWR